MWHTTTCSSAVCGTRPRHAGAAPDLAPSPTAVLAVDRPPVKASSQQGKRRIGPFCGGALAVGLACMRALAKRAAVGFARSRARFFPATQLKMRFCTKKTQATGSAVNGFIGGESPLCGSAECAGRTLHRGGGLLGSSWLSWSIGTLLVLGTTALLV